MKAMICQGRSIGGYPSRDKLVACWKDYFSDIPGLSEVVIGDGFQVERADEIAADYDILIGCRIAPEIFNAEFYKRHPKLKYVATTGHGFVLPDLKEAEAAGVTFTNTVYGDVTIAQYAMALLLHICHHIGEEESYYRESLARHESVRSPGHLAAITRQIELYNKTMGIIGLGSIGFWTARMAAGFGMKVIACSRHKKEGSKYDFIRQTSLEEVLGESDVISIHCPLTEKTRGMIGEEEIGKMKDGVILINTARGAILDEQALLKALNSGKIYAAGLDVVTGEPLHDLTPIFSANNAAITGHIAWLPEEARYRTIRIAADNLRNWLEGHPTSVIR